MGFFRKKEDRKKFDYSDDTKELFAERDAFYSRMRQEMGGGEVNPELANQKSERNERTRDEDLGDLLGDSDFNPYASKDEIGDNASSISAPTTPSSSSAAYSCQACGKEFQEKWGKCPSCGGDMKKVESQPAPISESAPVPPSNPLQDTNSGDPLDDLLGDFDTSPNSPAPDDSENSDSAVKMAGDDLGTEFGASRSSQGNRKVRKVKKVKRPRKSF